MGIVSLARAHSRANAPCVVVRPPRVGIRKSPTAFRGVPRGLDCSQKRDSSRRHCSDRHLREAWCSRHIFRSANSSQVMIGSPRKGHDERRPTSSQGQERIRSSCAEQHRGALDPRSPLHFPKNRCSIRMHGPFRNSPRGSSRRTAAKLGRGLDRPSAKTAGRSNRAVVAAMTRRWPT